MNVIPLFKSHYSRRSILTLEEAGLIEKLAKENKRNPELAPDSILDICVKNGLKELFLVEDGMNAFLEAYLNCQKAKINLRYGLRITMASDASIKSDEARRGEAKIVIFALNSEGYKRLIKISTHAATEGFYYEPRTDLKTLSENWNDECLALCIPFYDGFVHYNSLTFRSVVPQFVGKPTFFVEDNDLPFDDSIRKGIEKFDPKAEFERVRVKSIYYKDREDFRGYQTYRCIHNRSTLSKPNLDHFSSEEFCFESWKEQNE